jgi:hypothetical protein
MNPQDYRSGYITRTGQIVSTAEFEGARRLREALEGVGVIVSMDKVLDAFRRLPKDLMLSSPVIDEPGIEEGDEGEDDDL